MEVQRKGIDVSEYQGDIDFSVLKDEIDFVIIRMGYGWTHYDKKAVQNIQGCAENDIPFGAYWFSYALSVANAITEADSCVDIIEATGGTEKYKPRYPICFDFEGDSVRYFVQQTGREPSKEEMQAFAIAFCNRVEERGYYAVIYTNLNYYNKAFGELADRYDIWLAQWEVSTPSKPCGMWQVNSNFYYDGISGRVDGDIAYKDYPTIIENMHKEDEDEKEDEKEQVLEQVKEDYWDKYYALALEVIQGKWGNGDARRRALNSCGYDYGYVQSIVDIIA